MFHNKPNALDSDDVLAKISGIHREQRHVPIEVVVIYANQVVARGQIFDGLMNYQDGVARLELQVHPSEFRHPDPDRELHPALFITQHPEKGRKEYKVLVPGPVSPEGYQATFHGAAGRVVPATI